MINERFKREISTLSRAEIVHNNFFSELKRQNITNTKYAKDNNLDKTVLSKWKKMITTMSAEQIYQAAIYLHVTVNDLYYSSSEKKEIHVLTSDSNYVPIKAQQSIEIKMYEELFKHPFHLLHFDIFIFILLTMISFLTCKSSGFWLFLLLGIPLLCLQFYKEEIEHTKIFIVDYLDDIFYKIDNTKNQYFIKNLVLHILSFISIILAFILLLKRKFPEESNLETMIIFF